MVHVREVRVTASPSASVSATSAEELPVAASIPVVTVSTAARIVLYMASCRMAVGRGRVPSHAAAATATTLAASTTEPAEAAQDGARDPHGGQHEVEVEERSAHSCAPERPEQDTDDAEGGAPEVDGAARAEVVVEEVFVPRDQLAPWEARR